MLLIRNLLINRGDYAVVKYLSEDLQLGNSTHFAAALANRYVLPCTCLCIGCVTHFIADLNQQVCITICIYMLVYWVWLMFGSSYQQVCLLSITTTKYTKRVCINIYFKLHIAEIPEIFQPQIKVTFIAFWKVWTRHVAYIFITF